MNFTFMARLTARNGKGSLWVSIIIGKINLSVLLLYETPSLAFMIDISKTRRSVREKKVVSYMISRVKMLSFKVEIKRLGVLPLFTDFPLDIFFQKIYRVRCSTLGARKNLITHLTLLCHFADEKTKAGESEMTSPRSLGAGLSAL